MSVRRIGVGGAVEAERGREKPRRPRLGLMFLLSLGAGGAAGILAFMIIWVPTIYALASTDQPVPTLAAKTLFPPAPPLHRTINVVDPPVYHAPARAASPTPTDSASPSASPSPKPSRSPRPTPSGSPQPTPTND